jgi:hypothetical protein
MSARQGRAPGVTIAPLVVCRTRRGSAVLVTGRKPGRTSGATRDEEDPARGPSTEIDATWAPLARRRPSPFAPDQATHAVRGGARRRGRRIVREGRRSSCACSTGESTVGAGRCRALPRSRPVFVRRLRAGRRDERAPSPFQAASVEPSGSRGARTQCLRPHPSGADNEGTTIRQMPVTRVPGRTRARRMALVGRDPSRPWGQL